MGLPMPQKLLANTHTQTHRTQLYIYIDGTDIGEIYATFGTYMAYI